MNPIFKDPVLQEQFETNGYVVLPFFSQADIDALLLGYQNLPDINDEGFFANMFSDNIAYKKMTHDLITGVAQKAVDTLLINYKIVAASYVTKKNGESSYMPPHQDWSVVDETKYVSLNIWFPLVEVSKDNGAIYLLRKCHTLPIVNRGTLIPSAFNKVTNMNFETLTYLPMKPGEVLIYDHRMIHASPPNTTNQTRIAVATLTVPQDVQLVHFFQNPETNKIEKYQIEDDFFLHYTYGMNKLPENAKFLENVSYINPELLNMAIL